MEGKEALSSPEIKLNDQNRLSTQFLKRLDGNSTRVRNNTLLKKEIIKCWIGKIDSSSSDGEMRALELKDQSLFLYKIAKDSTYSDFQTEIKVTEIKEVIAVPDIVVNSWLFTSTTSANIFLIQTKSGISYSIQSKEKENWISLLKAQINKCITLPINSVKTNLYDLKKLRASTLTNNEEFRTDAISGDKKIHFNHASTSLPNFEARTRKSSNIDQVILFDIIKDLESGKKNNLENPSRRLSKDVLSAISCSMCVPQGIIKGTLSIKSTYLKFEPDKDDTRKNMNEMEKMIDAELAPLKVNYHYEMSTIKSLFTRRYLHQDNGFEIYFDLSNPLSSVFYIFESHELRNLVMREIHLVDSAMRQSPTVSLKAFLDSTKMHEKWLEGELSNFDYLMFLNLLSGRSFNDLNQYPVFPWVITDYKSKELDTNNESIFRDLSKPIGALNPVRLESLKKNFQEKSEKKTGMFVSHYSNPTSFVLYFLIRLEPYCSMHCTTQGGKIDKPDRLFRSVELTWNNVFTQEDNFKELIPQWYCIPEIFQNVNNVDFGSSSDKVVVDDVILPPWAKDAEEFVKINLEALESEYVSNNLHNWIDLIFGYKQRDPQNMFHQASYYGSIDIAKLTKKEKSQTPMQIFTSSHSKKNNVSKSHRFLQTFVDNIFDGKEKEIGETTIQTLEFIKSTYLRKFLASLLLSKKTDTGELPFKTYITILDIVKACLRESNNSKDLKSAKSYMDLASSFYWVNESGQSIFMLQSLVGHEIWGNTSLWADLFTEVEHSTSNKAVILTGFAATLFKKMIALEVKEDVRNKFVEFVNKILGMNLRITYFLQLRTSIETDWIQMAVDKFMVKEAMVIANSLSNIENHGNDWLDFSTNPLDGDDVDVNVYKMLKLLPEDLYLKSVVDTIAVDVKSMSISNLKKKELSNILLAYSKLDQEVGYVNGMNFIAANLLLHTDEENAFVLFVKMMQNYHVRNFYAPNLNAPLSMHSFIMHELILNHLPTYLNLSNLPDDFEKKRNKSINELRNEKSSIEKSFLKDWITLYTFSSNLLPKKILDSVWDIFFFSGWSIIFRIWITLLEYNERIPLAGEPLMIPNDLIEIAVNNSKVSEKEIEDLENKYYNIYNIKFRKGDNKINFDIIRKGHVGGSASSFLAVPLSDQINSVSQLPPGGTSLSTIQSVNSEEIFQEPSKKYNEGEPATREVLTPRKARSYSATARDDELQKELFESIQRKKDCSIKSLELLMKHFEYKKYNLDKEDLINVADVEGLLNNLGKQLSLEREISQLSLSKHFEKIKEKHEKLSRKGKNVQTIIENILDSLKKILTLLRPVNFDLLIELTEANKKSIEEVRGKEVCLLLGPSGCGKSTTIHFLCESKMEYLTNYVNSKPHVVIKECFYPELLEITNSNFSESETIKLKAVTIDLRETGKKITLADSPGFNDTRGVEIDFSNGVSTIEPIKTCKSLRPVIIICKESVGAKGGFFKTNFRSLAQMFNLDVALSSFSYIFTKFKNNEQANILDEIRGSINRVSALEEEKKILKDILKKARTKEDSFYDDDDESDDDANGHNVGGYDDYKFLVIDFENDKIGPKNALKQICLVPPISDFSCLNHFTNEDSYKPLENQLESDSKKIEFAISESLYEDCFHIMDQLVKLSTYLKLDSIERAYKENVNVINLHLSDLKKEYLRITSLIVDSRFAFDECRSDDLIKILSKLKCFKFDQVYINEGHIYLPELLRKQAELVFDTLGEEFKSNVNSLEYQIFTNTLNMSVLASTLEKLKLFSRKLEACDKSSSAGLEKLFIHVQKIYGSCLGLLQDEYDSKFKNSSCLALLEDQNDSKKVNINETKEVDISDVVNVLKVLRIINSIYSVSTSHETLQAKLDNYIKNKFLGSLAIVQSENLENIDIACQVIKSFGQWKKIPDCIEFPKETVERYETSLLEQASIVAKSLLVSLSNHFVNLQGSDFKFVEISLIIKELNYLLSIPLILSSDVFSCLEEYNQCNEDMTKGLSKCGIELLKILDKYQNQSEISSCDDLNLVVFDIGFKKLLMLQDLRFHHKNSIADAEYTNIVKEIKNYFSKILDSVNYFQESFHINDNSLLCLSNDIKNAIAFSHGILIPRDLKNIIENAKNIFCGLLIHAIEEETFSLSKYEFQFEKKDILTIKQAIFVYTIFSQVDLEEVSREFSNFKEVFYDFMKKFLDNFNKEKLEILYYSVTNSRLCIYLMFNFSSIDLEFFNSPEGDELLVEPEDNKVKEAKKELCKYFYCMKEMVELNVTVNKKQSSFPFRDDFSDKYNHWFGEKGLLVKYYQSIANSFKVSTDEIKFLTHLEKECQSMSIFEPFTSSYDIDFDKLKVDIFNKINSKIDSFAQRAFEQIEKDEFMYLLNTTREIRVSTEQGSRAFFLIKNCLYEKLKKILDRIKGKLEAKPINLEECVPLIVKLEKAKESAMEILGSEDIHSAIPIYIDLGYCKKKAQCDIFDKLKFVFELFNSNILDALRFLNNVIEWANLFQELTLENGINLEDISIFITLNASSSKFTTKRFSQMISELAILTKRYFEGLIRRQINDYKKDPDFFKNLCLDNAPIVNNYYKQLLELSKEESHREEWGTFCVLCFDAFQDRITSTISKINGEFLDGVTSKPSVEMREYLARPLLEALKGDNLPIELHNCFFDEVDDIIKDIEGEKEKEKEMLTSQKFNTEELVKIFRQSIENNKYSLAFACHKMIIENVRVLLQKGIIDANSSLDGSFLKCMEIAPLLIIHVEAHLDSLKFMKDNNFGEIENNVHFSALKKKHLKVDKKEEHRFKKGEIVYYQKDNKNVEMVEIITCYPSNLYDIRKKRTNTIKHFCKKELLTKIDISLKKDEEVEYESNYLNRKVKGTVLSVDFVNMTFSVRRDTEIVYQNIKEWQTSLINSIFKKIEKSHHDIIVSVPLESMVNNPDLKTAVESIYIYLRNISLKSMAHNIISRYYKDVNFKLADCCNRISIFFINNCRSFEKCKKDLDVIGITRALNYSKSLDSVFQLYKELSSTDWICKVFEVENLTLLNEEMSHNVMQISFSNFMKQIEKDLIGFSILENDKTRFNPNPSTRDDFYKDFDKKVLFLKNQTKHCPSFFKISIDEDEVMRKLKFQFTDPLQNFLLIKISEDFPYIPLYDEVDPLKIIKTPSSKKDSLYSEFQNLYDNFRAVEQFINIEGLRNTKETIDNCFITKYSQLTQRNNGIWGFKNICGNGVDDIPLKKIARCLIEMKTMQVNLAAFEVVIKSGIELLIDEVKRSIGNEVRFARLAFALKRFDRENGDGYGNIIIKDHRQFALSDLYYRQLKYKKKESEDLLITSIVDELKDANSNGYEKEFKDYLFSCCKDTISFFKELLNRMHSTEPLKDVVNEAKKEISDCPTINKEKVYSDKNMFRLIGYVFAWWALDFHLNVVEEKKINIKENATFLKPHPTQLIAILRLVGVGDSKIPSGSWSWVPFRAKDVKSDSLPILDRLKNHLLQVLTGEGKSVILGVSATVLALCGCKVSVACYSSYLSERDHFSFVKLFRAFGVEKLITYNTFSNLCEAIINKDGDMRRLVENCILEKGSSLPDRDATSSLPSVLLADEVDIFFGKEFFGATHNPGCKIRDPLLSELIDYVWLLSKQFSKIMENNEILEKVKKSDLYTNCCGLIKSYYKQLLEMSVTNMIKDAKKVLSENYNNKDNPEGRNYKIIDGRICYPTVDDFTSQIFYGYETVFTYMKEYEREKSAVLKLTVEEFKYLILSAGRFSFAELAKGKNYQYLIGLSGTLDVLNDRERDVLISHFNIRSHTYIPSSYDKEDKFKFDGVRVIKEEPCFQNFEFELVTEINRHLESLNSSIRNYQRAVLVFFDNSERLMAFYHSKEMQSLISQVSYITEKTSKGDREKIILRACFSGSITLLTRFYGRGTDFICEDEQLSEAGGIHVIQTFVSLELAEEVQIKGRTARQSNRGSYSLLLTQKNIQDVCGESCLSKINLNKDPSKMYSIIDEHRKTKHNEQIEDSKVVIKNTSEIHNASIVFHKNVLNNKHAEVFKYLKDNIRLNK